MIISIFAYSKNGMNTARKLRDFLQTDTVSLYTAERILEEDFKVIEKPSMNFYGRCFNASDAMIFVGACGIAVRHIAPFVKDKTTDPAVICIDELAKFVIPILSGHIGGANRLAERLAGDLHSVPVVTTATDINHRFSVDEWAAKKGYVIGSMKAAKAVSAAILEKDIPVCSDFPIRGECPKGTYPGDTGDIGIYIGYRKEEPFKETLRLFPKVLHLGIGCRRDTPEDTIVKAVMDVFNNEKLDIRAVKCAASIDLKKDEQGLLSFCEKLSIPVNFYTSEELLNVEGDFTPSAFVQSITGVDNVCERSALLGADQLIVKKTAGNGVTVAVALENTEVYFG